ncbi:30S ribosomal protein S15 [Candidatus Woesearchaeota archaeon]|nr:30S ribosomal protein S15 [Candidatus Woesearchaeota archaeon]
MARMHSRRKGKSGSKRPAKPQTPVWMSHPTKEVEILIMKLAKEKKAPSEIGMILRDSYGIPRVKAVTGKTIMQIMKEKNIAPEVPEDLLALIRKLLELDKHLEENKQDMPAKRGFQLTESKIRRVVKYYVRKGTLPISWKYDLESLKIYGA